MGKRSYAGGANKATLTAPTTEITNILAVTPLVGWPDYVVGPFIITVNRGQVNEEKMLCSEYQASGIVVSQRGYDGTVAMSHSAGETVEHTIGSVDVSEPNVHINSATGVHGLSGTTDIVGDDTTQTLTNKTMSGADNTFSAIPQSAVVGLPDIAAKAMPIGSEVMWAGTGGNPGNWILCNGQSVSRTTYSALYAAIGVTYGAGDGSTTFNLPNFTDRMPRGQNTPGVTGGAATHTITSAEMPSHQHGLASHTHTSPAHTHSTPALVHAVTQPVVAQHAARAHDHGGATGNEIQSGVMIATTDPMSPQAGTGVAAMVDSLPTHTHPITSDAGAAQPHTLSTNVAVGDHAAGNTGSTAPAATGAATGNTDAVGSGSSFSIVPPFLNMRFIILAK